MGRSLPVLALLFILTLLGPNRIEIVQAQSTSSAQYINPGPSTSPDPCEDPATHPALKKALRLACARPPIEVVRQAIIVGFLGGFVKRNEVKHPEVLFATHLRSRYGSAVHVEVFGNHEAKKALEEIVRRLNTMDDQPTAKDEVSIILYGHSWGASEVLSFARELQRHKIPVSLTIQIDSVKKFRQDNRTVPANVAKAVNFYQRKGLTPGQSRIVPADPSRTNILGNFQMKYEGDQINCNNYGWFSRVFNKPHHKIENDPFVWDQITSLIDSELSGRDLRIQAESVANSPPPK